MEPCLFRHGKKKIDFNEMFNALVLQWSHVFSDMVSAAGTGCTPGNISLQWSHVFSDMVRLVALIGAGLGVVLQWSHVFSDMVSAKHDPSLMLVGVLQWSHVFSDMVSREAPAGAGEPLEASMEPCLFRHGKRP